MFEVLKVLSAALLLLLLSACMLQERLIFFRQPPAPAPRIEAPGVLEDLSLDAADGTRLRGWLARFQQGRAPLVIYFGGNAEETSWTVGEARRFGGWSVMSMNYRGYGRSEGNPGEEALFADALRIYDAAAARPDVDPDRIVAMGRSLGSGVAVHLASRRRTAGAVLVTPFDSLVAVGAEHYPFLPVRWLLKHRFDSLALAPSIKSPALILAAAQDTIVPPQHARRLYEAWGGAREWIEFTGVGHNDVDAAPGYWPAIADFLGRLPPSRAP